MLSRSARPATGRCLPLQPVHVTQVLTVYPVGSEQLPNTLDPEAPLLAMQTGWLKDLNALACSWVYPFLLFAMVEPLMTADSAVPVQADVKHQNRPVDA